MVTSAPLILGEVFVQPVSLPAIAELPHALHDGQQFAARLAGRRPAVFLDYDGTLTPIVDRPEDAVISDSMREVVRHLARRCPVCVVSGRDRTVVQRLLGVDDLMVAGSHGFDIGDRAVQHNVAAGFDAVLATVIARLRAEIEPVSGATLEIKRFSVAVHYRLVAARQRPIVEAVVDALLAEHPDQLKVTPGKMVYEIQPNVDWNKGKAVQYLLEVLHVDVGDVVPLYLGDDITDEDAFTVLKDGQGIGVVVANLDDPGEAGRVTAADFVLESVEEVERFLNALAR